jgi:hypothetical protein
MNKSYLILLNIQCMGCKIVGVAISCSCKPKVVEIEDILQVSEALVGLKH